VTPKKLAEFWVTQFALTGIRPVWWKQLYIYIVLKISPPRYPWEKSACHIQRSPARNRGKADLLKKHSAEAALTSDRERSKG
jgi:hypothetical protein